MPSQDQLLAAYATTLFEANTTLGSVVLKVGEYNDCLANLYRTTGTQCAAYITAWNPASVPLNEVQNGVRHTDLLASLKTRGYTYSEGYGRDPTGQWPPERSVLVLGIPDGEACAVGREFGQAAIVVVDADAIPRLRWLLDVADSPNAGSKKP
jgi:hypothetical protein